MFCLFQKPVFYPAAAVARLPVKTRIPWRGLNLPRIAILGGSPAAGWRRQCAPLLSHPVGPQGVFQVFFHHQVAFAIRPAPGSAKPAILHDDGHYNLGVFARGKAHKNGVVFQLHYPCRSNIPFVFLRYPFWHRHSPPVFWEYPWPYPLPLHPAYHLITTLRIHRPGYGSAPGALTRYLLSVVSSAVSPSIPSTKWGV